MKIHLYLLLYLIVNLGLLGCKENFEIKVEPSHSYTYNINARLDSLGIKLTTPSAPVANYVNVVRTGDLLFLAGKGPKDESGNNIVGRLGEDMSIEEGYAAARRVGIAQLSVLKKHLGDLSKVKRIVKVMGMVKSTDDFTNQSQVVNGYSDLMVEVFSERGKHARAAVGMSALPGGICIEVEMIVEVSD